MCGCLLIAVVCLFEIKSNQECVQLVERVLTTVFRYGTAVASIGDSPQLGICSCIF